MPTIVTHGFVATLLGKGLARGRMPARFWFLSVLCSILPDADVLGFRLGINYEDLLGHRGLSHSLLFAIILSLVVTFLAFPQLPPRWTRLVLFPYFFVVTASHPIQRLRDTKAAATRRMLQASLAVSHEFRHGGSTAAKDQSRRRQCDKAALGCRISGLSS
jgi:hypothetical protein